MLSDKRHFCQARWCLGDFACNPLYQPCALYCTTLGLTFTKSTAIFYKET
jgi:hypothetical protein